MKLGIDASNIRSGGGLTHLREILANGNPEKDGITEVVVWASSETLKKLPNKDWLVKKTDPMLNKSFVYSFLFQIFHLSKRLRNDKIDVLFVPGSTYMGSFRNFVTMSQNMLPFEKDEYSRYTKLKSRLRFMILRLTQSYSFRRAKGVIFLTEYAKSIIESKVNLKSNNIIIAHGINTNFLQEPKPQRNINEYSMQNPFKLLYVSIITVYKHQWNIAAAVLRLREEGYPVELTLVGSSSQESLMKLEDVLKADDSEGVKYKGLVPYEELASIYKDADGFIFGSSCENQPIILIEAMTAGLPIISSNMGPMPEVLGDAGYYFNPLDVDSIYSSLKKYLLDEDQRSNNADASFNKSKDYTWQDCSRETFKYLSKFEGR